MANLFADLHWGKLKSCDFRIERVYWRLVIMSILFMDLVYLIS